MRMAPELNLHYMPRSNNWIIKRNNADVIASFATLDEIADMLDPYNLKATANVITKKLVWAANRKSLKDYLVPKMVAHILGSYGSQMARVRLSTFYDKRKTGENHYTCVPLNNHGLHDFIPLTVIIDYGIIEVQHDWSTVLFYNRGVLTYSGKLPEIYLKSTLGRKVKEVFYVPYVQNQTIENIRSINDVYNFVIEDEMKTVGEWMGLGIFSLENSKNCSYNVNHYD